MIEKLKELLSKDIEEIISTPLSLDLLKVYSTLYLYGEKPNTCAKSQRSYYNQLKINGMDKAKQNTQRTCKPNWKGNLYIPKEARHFNDLHITDEEAIRIIERKHISEDKFSILPEGFKAKKVKTELTPKELRANLVKDATDLKITFKANISTKKLQDLVDVEKAKVITSLQESRLLEVIELGVDPIPENLGSMSDEDYRTFKEELN